MPTLTTEDGHSLYYETHGFDAGGPALLFLNGMTQTTRHWHTHCRDLRDERPVVAYDARGQGQSDDPVEPPTLDVHVRDLTQLIDKLDIEQVDLAGFSHGARIALGYAAERPDALRKLILCSATAESTALARTIVRSWRGVLDTGGLEALSWAALPAIVGNHFLDGHEKLVDNMVRASTERNSERGVRLLLEGMEGFPELADLAQKVAVDTLVISASDDPLVTTEGAEKLAELCGGIYGHVDDCGHTIPIERPDRFQNLLVGFL